MRLLALKDITPLQGGLLILVDGKIAGAIGVSGALSAQDDQIAKAGADVLAKGSTKSPANRHATRLHRRIMRASIARLP